MNDSLLRAQGSRCYEWLKVVVDMKESGVWAQGSKCYEQLGLWMIRMNRGHMHKALDVMNNLGL